MRSTHNVKSVQSHSRETPDLQKTPRSFYWMDRALDTDIHDNPFSGPASQARDANDQRSRETQPTSIPTPEREHKLKNHWEHLLENSTRNSGLQRSSPANSSRFRPFGSKDFPNGSSHSGRDSHFENESITSTSGDSALSVSSNSAQRGPNDSNFGSDRKRAKIAGLGSSSRASTSFLASAFDRKRGPEESNDGSVCTFSSSDSEFPAIPTPNELQSRPTSGVSNQVQENGHLDRRPKMPAAYMNHLNIDSQPNTPLNTGNFGHGKHNDNENRNTNFSARTTHILNNSTSNTVKIPQFSSYQQPSKIGKHNHGHLSYGSKHTNNKNNHHDPNTSKKVPSNSKYFSAWDAPKLNHQREAHESNYENSNDSTTSSSCRSDNHQKQSPPTKKLQPAGLNVREVEPVRFPPRLVPISHPKTLDMKKAT
ncbi:hypothetical protein DFH27DRAFT_656696 [Peziza echinospora]|nr:hypothetical protein DFH27DRAFT_656696 [Peziza echinospora]